MTQNRLIYDITKKAGSIVMVKYIFLLSDIYKRINTLRDEAKQYSRNNEICTPPLCPPIYHSFDGPPNAVFFQLNSADIDKGQEVVIYNNAEYLKRYPNQRIKIVGYADKQTGSELYNLKLSEKRAFNVAYALIHKYKINPDRIKVEWIGSSEQPLKDNEWNRIVFIFYIDK